MFNKYLKQLTHECELIWHNGRQLCEAVSLNGHACIYELHKVPDCNSLNISESNLEPDISDIDEKSENEEDSRYYGVKSRSRSMRSDSNKRDTAKANSDRHSSNSSRNGTRNKLVLKAHNSNIITISASNCGEFQMERTVYGHKNMILN